MIKIYIRNHFIKSVGSGPWKHFGKDTDSVRIVLLVFYLKKYAGNVNKLKIGSSTNTDKLCMCTICAVTVVVLSTKQANLSERTKSLQK